MCRDFEIGQEKLQGCWNVGLKKSYVQETRISGKSIRMTERETMQYKSLWIGNDKG